MAATETDKTFDLSVVTPDGAIFEGEANMIIVPGDAGEIGVLPRHAPLVAMLRAGETRIRVGSDWTFLATGPGYFKIQRDRAIALVDDAVRGLDIDVAQAHASRRRTPRPRRRGRSSNAPRPARRGSTAGSPSSGSVTPRTRSASPEKARRLIGD